MDERNARNKALDKIGIAVLKASSLKYDELEQVIGDRSLFVSIQRRIRLQKDSTSNVRPAVLTLFSARSVVGGLGMAVIIIAVFGLMSIKQLSRSGVETVRVDSPKSKVSIQVAVRPETTQPDLASRPVAAAQRRSVQAEPAVMRTRAERRVHARPTVESGPEVQMEFYPLAGTAPETMGEGRVVRVELPRASLVALGANLALDSGKPTVKTDLLLGQDGVPRAIRFVE